jgi:hypothetical protein
VKIPQLLQARDDGNGSHEFSLSNYVILITWVTSGKQRFEGSWIFHFCGNSWNLIPRFIQTWFELHYRLETGQQPEQPQCCALTGVSLRMETPICRKSGNWRNMDAIGASSNDIEAEGALADAKSADL